MAFLIFFGLGSLSVAGLLDLAILLLGETDAKASEDESVLGLHLANGFDEVLPLFDELAQFISGHGHAVEAGSDVLALGVLDKKSNFSPGGGVGVVLQISERNINNSSFYSFGSDFSSGGSGHESLSEVFDLKRSRRLEVVPFLSG